MSKNPKPPVQTKNTPTQFGLVFEDIIPSINDDTRNGKFPKLFIDVPIFEPLRKRSVADTIWDKAHTYRTPDGIHIERYGPGLDIFDEDTLIAILKLTTTKRIEGPRESFPIPLTPNTDEETDTASVYLGEISPSQINEFLGRGTGGAELKSCRASIRRLSLNQFIFSNYELAKEGKTGFFDFIGDLEEDGRFTIQLRPVMVKLLETYALINVDIRKRLSDVGKAVYRYLCDKPVHFSILLEDLKEAIMYHGSIHDLKKALIGIPATKRTPERKGQLVILQEAGWLEWWEVTGTGRRTPFTVSIARKED